MIAPDRFGWLRPSRPLRFAASAALLSALAGCGPQSGGANPKAAQLQVQERSERLAAAKTEATQAQATAQSLSLSAAADKAAGLKAAASALRDAAAKLDAGVEAAPDFGAQALAASARLRALTGDRAQRLAAANQIVLDTTQIDVARSRYAVGLNRQVETGVPVDDDVRRFCASPDAAPFGRACADALAAGAAFERSQVRAAVAFKAFKETVREELDRQNAVAAQLGR
ncbi:MAG TPA: hypothetical protein VMU59_13680 [Caulobacteraceae bacterium]|nr:hypothetical protein [Caulobacteraceae bacterium]